MLSLERDCSETLDVLTACLTGKRPVRYLPAEVGRGVFSISGGGVGDTVSFGFHHKGDERDEGAVDVSCTVRRVGGEYFPIRFLRGDRYLETMEHHERGYVVDIAKYRIIYGLVSEFLRSMTARFPTGFGLKMHEFQLWAERTSGTKVLSEDDCDDDYDS